MLENGDVSLIDGPAAMPASVSYLAPKSVSKGLFKSSFSLLKMHACPFLVVLLCGYEIEDALEEL